MAEEHAQNHPLTDPTAGDPASVVAAPKATSRFLERIPHDFARAHLLIEVEDSDGARVLRAERTPEAALWNLGVMLGAQLETEVADEPWIAEEIDRAYESHERKNDAPNPDGPQADESDVSRLIQAADRDLLSTQGKAPVVKLVDALLFEAQRLGASDLHIQPLESVTLVRYRVDGVLQDARELAPALTQAITSRIKVMGRMDIAERRIPQDGRAAVTVGRGEHARSIDLRISTLPTSYGERVVVRLLDTNRGLRLARLDQIGMPERIRTRFERASSRANGIVLLTGPTGSGKTTTLYATLRWIASKGRAELSGAGALNVMTIEDPIEYELSTSGIAISQAQVNTKKGVTFASGLRHILRQDPDVVMVGEIRDAETARIAIQASLTGHLVFSTLHTNDAASAVTRLIDLGVEPYLVGASLSAVLAQRLVRTIHSDCSGAGCDACFGSGYKGRTGLFELLTVDDGMQRLITEHATLSAVREAAIRGGTVPLRLEGERLVTEGVTTTMEIERVASDLGATIKDDVR